MALNKILKGMLADFKKDYILADLEENRAYEYLVNYLLVSRFHSDAFSDKGDLERIIVDEKGQFGLDAIAIIVNGNLVVSKEDIAIYAKSKKMDVDIVFIQTKTEEKCDTGDLLKTIQASKNFMNDFEKITEKNENIKNAKEIYDELFEYQNFKYCTATSPKCHIYFVTAANEWDTKLVNNICAKNEEEIKVVIQDIKNTEIKVFGREYVINAYNELKNSSKVEIYLKNCLTLDKIEGVNEAYIGYLSGDEYLKIISNVDGELRRRIFYENVRDYQGMDNAVNTGIRNTIKNKNTRGQFVLLNNGVTIITKSVTSLGGNMYELADFQVVNGCQTSNEIFNLKDYAKEILVPVKIIYTVDPDIINSIVKATNRQSPVPEEAFIALDRYHKELQLLFDEYSKEMPLELFYERRSGEEDNIKNKNGKYQIVTLHGIIRTVTSVYFQDAHVVYNNNPANILKNRNDKFFLRAHKQDIYYISSYLFAEFVHMQQKGIFTKSDYSIRFYIIMVARCLMMGAVEVPEFSSKKINSEIDILIKILKGDKCSDYFFEAKEIVVKTLNEDIYASKTKTSVLRSAEFCKRVKENTGKYLEQKK